MGRLRNIRVSQEVIGTVNIGDIQVIDVAISHIQHHGNLDLSHALWEFTQEVLESREIEPAARKEMVEQLAFVSDQVVTSQDQKQQSAARAVLADLATTASTIPRLASVWGELAPLLQRALP